MTNRPSATHSASPFTPILPDRMNKANVAVAPAHLWDPETSCAFRLNVLQAYIAVNLKIYS
jgi:hypothetical protein